MKSSAGEKKIGYSREYLRFQRTVEGVLEFFTLDKQGPKFIRPPPPHKVFVNAP